MARQYMLDRTRLVCHTHGTLQVGRVRGLATKTTTKTTPLLFQDTTANHVITY